MYFNIPTHYVKNFLNTFKKNGGEAKKCLRI